MRGNKDTVHLMNIQEALEITKLAGAYRDDIELRYPYYDEEGPLYNPDHGDEFDFANAAIVMKISLTIQGSYPEYFGDMK